MLSARPECTWKYPPEFCTHEHHSPLQNQDLAPINTGVKAICAYCDPQMSGSCSPAVGDTDILTIQRCCTLCSTLVARASSLFFCCTFPILTSSPPPLQNGISPMYHRQSAAWKDHSTQLTYLRACTTCLVYLSSTLKDLLEHEPSPVLSKNSLFELVLQDPLKGPA